jgi:hypothetical protein
LGTVNFYKSTFFFKSSNLFINWKWFNL